MDTLWIIVIPKEERQNIIICHLILRAVNLSKKKGNEKLLKEVVNEELYQKKGIVKERSVDTMEIKGMIKETLEWERN